MRLPYNFYKLFIYLFLLLFFFTSKNLAQEDYLYENLSVSDGLSSARFNIFQTIYQDKYGFLWFGTTDGLNRYNGYDFKVYKNVPGDSTSLQSSNIYNINEDADGNLWVGTTGYMSIFDPLSDSFTNYSIDQGNINISQEVPIFRSLVDSKNNFWIATQGKSVQKWNKDRKEWELIPFMLDVDGSDSLIASELTGVAAITELRNGNLLASIVNMGIYYYNENSNAFEKFSFPGSSHINWIVEIYEDKSGKIWFAGRGVLYEYNPITFSLSNKILSQHFKAPTDQVFFFNLTENEDNTFLLSSSHFGLLTYDPKTEKLELLKIGGELGKRGVSTFAQTIFVDNFGVYWCGLADNGVLKFDPKRRPFNFYEYNKDNVSSTDNYITTDLLLNYNNPNEVLISTRNNGILRFDLKDNSIKEVKINLPEIYSDSSNTGNLVMDDNGRLWFPSSQTKISSYDLRTGKTETYRVIERNMLTGSGEFIFEIEYIPQNTLVIASSLGGYIFNTVSKEIKALPSIMNRTYSDELISNVSEVISGNKSLASLIKVGEAANVTKQFSLTEKTDVLIVCLGEGQYPNGIFDFGQLQDSEGENIWAMNEMNNTFYHGGGYKNRIQMDVITLKPGDYKLFYTTDIGHSYNNFNVKPPNNPEWYGIQVIELNETLAGAIEKKISDEKQNKNYAEMFSTSTLLSSRKYPNSIWVGANEKGIVKYDLISGKHEQYFIEEFKNKNVYTGEIFEDSKGRLWITIDPSGFYRFDPITKTFTSNASIPDLPTTGINGMIEDFQGNLWIKSSGGITNLIQNSDGSWSTSNYDSKDGVPGGFGRGSLITRDGQILFGSFNGITAFYPSVENTKPPIPVITDITVSDVSIFDKESKLKLEKSIFEIEEINLSYSQNYISFDFSSLHYSRPNKNRTSYILEGLSDHWVLTDKNFASFTNLDPGSYTFKVKAFSGFGVPGNTERSIKINIAPPWYRTTIAYISYGFLFIALVFGIDRVQRRRILRQEREKQKIQEAELRAVAAEAQARAVQAENDRKSKELEEARQLQLSMLPKKLPQLPNLDIAVYMKTATEVGGDYYDFHVAMDGTLTVVVGDATGHGMKAGTMVTAAKSLFSTHAANPDILFTFSEISRCIKHMDMHLLTMCMTVMKIKQNKMIMSTAGMPPTLIFRNHTKQLEEIALKGMPLGAVESFPYALKETELNTGDTLLVMSDGYPELFNSEKELYGYERVQNDFHKVAEKSPEQIIERLKMNALEWTGNCEPDDDITFVVIKVK